MSLRAGTGSGSPLPSSLLTWEEMTSWDDAVPLEVRAVLDKLSIVPGEGTCSSLRRHGQYWFYCGEMFDGDVSDDFSPGNPVYTSQQGALELQSWCASDRSCHRCSYHPTHQDRF